MFVLSVPYSDQHICVSYSCIFHIPVITSVSNVGFICRIGIHLVAPHDEYVFLFGNVHYHRLKRTVCFVTTEINCRKLLILAQVSKKTLTVVGRPPSNRVMVTLPNNEWFGFRGFSSSGVRGFSAKVSLYARHSTTCSLWDSCVVMGVRSHF